MARRLAVRFDDTQFDLERVQTPDSAVAVAAQRLCESASSPALFAHCLRTYAWAALLGQRAKQRVDSELLFVASLLHDLGLTAHAPPTPDAPCFAVSGARAAHNFLLKQGLAAERAQRAAECISLHMNPYVPEEHSHEAQLMAAGAALDAVGSRKHELPSNLREAVLERYPHAGFGIELQCCMRAHIGAWPSTRAAFIEKNFGFLSRIARNRL